ncbi:MAG: M1 family metallopeptidase, partial [Acidobacteria bacterium]|nr:M1 family metallopeptidase [Acidobacteriota bacterium]
MPKGYGLGLTFKPETAASPRLIHTLSFPEGARHWFPCYDHPNDKATHEIIATVDAGYRAIANGVLRSVTQNRARREKTFHWVQTQPHPTYLYVFVAGPYVQVKDTKGVLPISYWVYPQDVPHAERTFGKTREIIEFFNREFGYPYPWPKYDQITLPDFRGGAESTSATVIGDHASHDARAEQDFSTHWLVAHEAAHQWWGDLVTMRDWSHTWLNESFATYYEHVYRRHLLGEESGALDLLSKKRAHLAEARHNYQRPIVLDGWNWPNENFDRHAYQKGAVVLAMLRAVTGDAPFRRSMTHYLKK